MSKTAKDVSSQKIQSENSSTMLNPLVPDFSGFNNPQAPSAAVIAQRDTFDRLAKEFKAYKDSLRHATVASRSDVRNTARINAIQLAVAANLNYQRAFQLVEPTAKKLNF